MLDQFSGYNQIQVNEADQFKTTFTTPWGTFAYNRMPFVLINVGENFQRGMNLSFEGLKDRIIIIYLDDLIVFSKKRKDHITDLGKVLQRYKYHGISLNPNKSIFCVTEGKFLGHIVSQEGVKIDPNRVRDIQQLNLPLRKIGVKSFFWLDKFLDKICS